MKHFLKGLKNHKSITIFMGWTSLMSFFLLITPTAFSNLTVMSSLSLQYTPYLWIALLISGSFLLTQVIIISFHIISINIATRNKVLSRSNMIKCLDFEEKAVLREFIIQQRNVLSLPLTEPAVTNLLSAGVLEPAFETQEIKGRTRLIKLSIAIDARSKLTHRVLGLPIGQLTDEQAKTLKSARPSYARHNYITIRD